MSGAGAPPSESSSSTRGRALTLGLSACLVVSLALGPEAGLFALTCTLCVFFTWQRLGLLSWQTGIPLYYGVMFLGLPVANELLGQGISLATEQEVGSARLTASLGLACFCGGGYLGRALIPERPYVPGPLRGGLIGMLHERGVMTVLALLGGGALLFSYLFAQYGLQASSVVQDSSGLVTMLSSFSFLGVVVNAVAWSLYFSERDRRVLPIAVLTTVMLFAVALFSNSKGQLLEPLVAMSLAYWGARRRVPLILLVGTAFIYLLFAFPLVTYLRSSTGIFSDGSSRVDVASKTLDVVFSDSWMAPQSELAGRAAVASLSRSLLEYFSRIVQDAGERVPLFDGATFSAAWSGFLPRFLSPVRSPRSIGNWTAVAYGVVPSDDLLTNVSPSYMGEFLMNFGLPGLAVGMLLVGVAAVVVDRRVIVEGRNWTMPIMVRAVLWQESVLGQSLFPFLKLVGFLFALLWLLSGLRRVLRSA